MPNKKVKLHSGPELREEMEQEIDPANVPSGKNPWACFGTVYNQEGKLLVINYHPHAVRSDESQIKFAGGSFKYNPPTRVDKNPEDTFIREMQEEVLGGDGEIKAYDPTHRVVKGDHVKYCCLFSIKSENGGEILRPKNLSEGKQEGEGERTFNEMLSPPYFIDAVDLVDEIFYTHQPFLFAVCRVCEPIHENFKKAKEKMEQKGFFSA